MPLKSVSQVFMAFFIATNVDTADVLDQFWPSFDKFDKVWTSLIKLDQFWTSWTEKFY